MKILVIPSWYTQEDNPISGVFFREQALALQEHGLDIIMMVPEVKSIRAIRNFKSLVQSSYTLDEGMPTYRKSTSLHVPRIHKVRLTIKKIMAFNMMKQIIEKHGMPDIIHAHAILDGGWVGSLLSKKYGIPLIVTEHSSAYSRNLILDYQKPLIKETLQQASKVLAVGEGLIEELKKYTTKEITYIPNIVDIDKATQFRHEAVKNEGVFTYFTLSLLSKNKKVDNIIRAFHLLIEKNVEAQLWVGGNGAELHNLKKLVDQLNLQKNIKFLGELNREQVFKYMNSCDVFISASEVETFGVVLIEALACGKPIIATKSGGPNLIVNEQNGFLVKVNDVEELVQAMMRMKRNYHQYNTEVIVEDCKKRFSKEAVCEQLTTIYSNVIDNFNYNSK